MKTIKWISELKIGDKFVVSDDYGIDYYYVHTVTKITNKQIVTREGGRFWKENGRQVGAGGWHINYMKQIDDQVLAQLLKQKLKRILKSLNVDKFSDEDAKALYDYLLVTIIKKYYNKEPK